MSGGDRSGGYGGYGGAREKMIGLSWSRHVIAHELRCQGDYGGFLGTTETGCSVVVGPRPGSGAARSGGVSGRLGDTVLFLLGGLGVDGIATRYVRMFVPDLGGGSWKECAPLGDSSFAALSVAQAAVSSCWYLRCSSGGPSLSDQERVMIQCTLEHSPPQHFCQPLLVRPRRTRSWLSCARGKAARPPHLHCMTGMRSSPHTLQPEVASRAFRGQGMRAQGSPRGTPRRGWCWLAECLIVRGF